MTDRRGVYTEVSTTGGEETKTPLVKLTNVAAFLVYKISHSF